MKKSIIKLAVQVLAVGSVATMATYAVTNWNGDDTLDNIRNTVSTLVGTIRNLNSEVETLEDTIIDLRNDLDDLQRELENEQGNNVTNSEKITELEGEIERLEGEINRLEGEKTVLEEALDAANAEIARLEGEVNSANNAVDGLWLEIQYLIESLDLDDAVVDEDFVGEQRTYYEDKAVEIKNIISEIEQLTGVEVEFVSRTTYGQYRFSITGGDGEWANDWSILHQIKAVVIEQLEDQSSAWFDSHSGNEAIIVVQ